MKLGLGGSRPSNIELNDFQGSDVPTTLSIKEDYQIEREDIRKKGKEDNQCHINNDFLM